MTKIEEMGWDAFHKGIKDSSDDPAFTMYILAEGPDNVSEFTVDDWNQGWLKAYYVL